MDVAVGYCRRAGAGVAAGLSAAQLISLGILAFGLIWMRMRREVTAAHPGIHAA